jgi:hypothetical protein
MESFSSTRSSLNNTISLRKQKQQEKSRYNLFINICKARYVAFCKINNTILPSQFTCSVFKQHIKDADIELPSFKEFLNGKNIFFGSNGFEMIIPTRMNSTCIGSSDAIQKLNLDLTELEHLPSSSVEENQSVNNDFAIPIEPINILNSSIYSTEGTVIERNMGMNKTIELEDINWEVTHISAHRINCNKNQFKVHYKDVKNKKYRP